MSDDWYADELEAAGIRVDPIYGPDRAEERAYRMAKERGGMKPCPDCRPGAPCAEHDGLYGLLDTVDNLWLGTDDGPRLYANPDVAAVAAQMADVQLRQDPGRTRAVRYAGDAVRVRDEQPTAMPPLEALRRLERGGF